MDPKFFTWTQNIRPRLRKWTCTYGKNIAWVLMLFAFSAVKAYADPFASPAGQIQTIMTGTIAHTMAMIAIVICGFGFFMGGAGAKWTTAGIAVGIIIACHAADIYSILGGS